MFIRLYNAMSSISIHTTVQDPSEREREEKNIRVKCHAKPSLLSPATYNFEIFEVWSLRLCSSKYVSWPW